MKQSYKIGFIVLVSSILGSVLGVAIYIQLQGTQPDIKKEFQHALNVSAAEFRLSEDFSRVFNSTIPNSFTDAADRSINAVVSIRSYEESNIRSKRVYSKTSGSGVIISDLGYIVTNYHVIAEARNILVTLNDRREFKAKLVGFDESTDLALLQVEARDLDHLVIGNSDSLRIGEWVLAIGNPFRLTSSVTAGIVSAKARNINILENRGIESFIQTDAAINPGNSGGALINTNGELVGINTAIMTYSGKYEGFSFAIPSNLVRKIVNDIREFGVVQRGWLGVSILEMNEQRATDLGLEFIGGVLLDIVELHGAANEAGLQKNDVITRIDGIKTNTIPQFLERLASYRPGDQITVRYFRDGKRRESRVTLRNQLNTTDFIAVRKDKSLKDIGFEIRDLDQMEKDRMNTEGIVVVSIYKGSIIEQTNMDPGYIITKINDIEVYTAEQFINILEKSDSNIFLEGFYENYPGKYPYSFYK